MKKEETETVIEQKVANLVFCFMFQMIIAK